MKLSTIALVAVALGGCALSHGRSGEAADGGSRVDARVRPRAGSYHEAVLRIHRVGPLPRLLRSCIPRGRTVHRCLLTQREPDGGCAGRGRRRTPAGCVIDRDETETSGYWFEDVPTGFCWEDSQELVVDMEGVPDDVLISIACTLETYLPELGVGGWRDGETPGAVGRSCSLPEVPTGGLADVETLVTVDADRCGGLPCIAFGLSGDPRVTCDVAEEGEECIPSFEVAEHVVCSCRCSRLEGDPTAPLCTCPEGTVCDDTLLRVSDTGVGGGWCVPCTDDPLVPDLPRCRS